MLSQWRAPFIRSVSPKTLFREFFADLVHGPVRNRSRLGCYYSRDGVGKSADLLRVPSLAEAMNECRSKGIARTNRISHFYSKAWHLRGLAVLENCATVLTTRDTNDLRSVAVGPTARETLNRFI